MSKCLCLQKLLNSGLVNNTKQIMKKNGCNVSLRRVEEYIGWKVGRKKRRKKKDVFKKTVKKNENTFSENIK